MSCLSNSRQEDGLIGTTQFESPFCGLNDCVLICLTEPRRRYSMKYLKVFTYYQNKIKANQSKSSICLFIFVGRKRGTRLEGNIQKESKQHKQPKGSTSNTGLCRCLLSLLTFYCDSQTPL